MTQLLRTLNCSYQRTWVPSIRISWLTTSYNSRVSDAFWPLRALMQYVMYIDSRRHTYIHINN